MKSITKWFDLDDGVRCGKFIGDYDVRGYDPPKGYTATAADVEYHPVTGKYMARTEWWIFITPKRR